MSLELDRNDPLAFVDGGEVVMENPGHHLCRDEVFNVLRHHFGDREDVHVAGNLAIQYDESDPWKVLSADVFVCLDAPPGGGPRPPVDRSWQTWVHGIPTVVIEIVSPSTVRNDQSPKLRTYRAMGVSEYLLFDPRFDDPENGSLPEPLIGYQRRDDEFVRIDRPDGWLSPRLGLRLTVQGGELRFADPITGELLVTTDEARREATEARREATEARREVEELRRRLEATEAELRRLRGEG